uniref:class C sortase n=1 Tax=Candidatus Fimivicinus sp. TaxID=3056640 RepID=UPI003FEEF65A
TKRKGRTRMKKRKNIILLLLFLIGLGLILYPTVSSWIQDWNHSKAINDYRKQVEAENAAQLEQKKEEARAYNGRLANPQKEASATQDASVGYYDLLSFQSVMGYLEIPEIGVNLPIYHGTSDLVLEMGVGHLESSSLPIGGEGTHAVLMGHRGLPSSTLFNKLPKLKEGSRFYLHMLDETLAYEVDQIKVIEPDNLADLQIVPGRDYVTLMTCTPYMINSHRLIVRGHRIATPPPGEEAAPAAAVQVQPQAEQAVWPWILAAVAAACLLALCIILLAKKKRRKGPRA